MEFVIAERRKDVQVRVTPRRGLVVDRRGNRRSCLRCREHRRSAEFHRDARSAILATSSRRATGSVTLTLAGSVNL